MARGCPPGPHGGDSHPGTGLLHPPSLGTALAVKNRTKVGFASGFASVYKVKAVPPPPSVFLLFLRAGDSDTVSQGCLLVGCGVGRGIPPVGVSGDGEGRTRGAAARLHTVSPSVPPSVPVSPQCPHLCPPSVPVSPQCPHLCPLSVPVSPQCPQLCPISVPSCAPPVSPFVSPQFGGWRVKLKEQTLHFQTFRKSSQPSCRGQRDCATSPLGAKP